MSNFLADYEPVEDRIRAFWEEHPEGRITTELVPGTEYIVRAEVYRLPPVASASMTGGVQLPDATGYAQESVTQRGVNSTSALENCETSAIGRALANLGYAAKGKRPSREEMSKTSSAASSPSGGADEPVAGSSSPVAAGGSSGGEPKSLGEGGDGSPSDSTTLASESVLAHRHGNWIDAPRAGFVICQNPLPNGTVCGYAERGTRVAESDRVKA